MVLQTWIIECLKMYKISKKKVINFVTKAMENWKVKLTAREKTLAEVKIQRSIFQGYLLSQLLFITMIPHNYILRKCTEGDKFTKSSKRINYLMYMDDIKLFA